MCESEQLASRSKCNGWHADLYDDIHCSVSSRQWQFQLGGAGYRLWGLQRESAGECHGNVHSDSNRLQWMREHSDSVCDKNSAAHVFDQRDHDGKLPGGWFSRTNSKRPYQWLSNRIFMEPRRSDDTENYRNCCRYLLRYGYECKWLYGLMCGNGCCNLTPLHRNADRDCSKLYCTWWNTLELHEWL